MPLTFKVRDLTTAFSSASVQPSVSHACSTRSSFVFVDVEDGGAERSLVGTCLLVAVDVRA